MKLEDILKCISETTGVSGYEEDIRKQIEMLVSQCQDVKIYTDRIGNLICYKKGLQSDIKIMIIAHMDEVGFQVISVDGDNICLKTLGNVKTWNAINQRISSSDDEKAAILYCEDPENMKPHDFEKIKAVPIKGSLEIGDVLGFDTPFIDSGTQWIGRALDNRISCGILIEILMSNINNKNDIYCVFSTQEEISMRGARVAVAALMPEVIIDLDVSPVGERNSLKMGHGVGIKLSDSIGVSSSSLVKQMERYAKDCDISFQREVSDCGTSELIITNEKDAGAERVGLSVPCRNMHSPMTMVCKEDVFACRQLLMTALKNGLSVDSACKKI